MKSSLVIAGEESRRNGEVMKNEEEKDPPWTWRMRSRERGLVSVLWSPGRDDYLWRGDTAH